MIVSSVRSLALLAGCLFVQSDPLAPAIDAYVNDLSSDDPQVRDKATRALEKMGTSALSSLETKLGPLKDVEVRLRVKGIVDAIRLQSSNTLFQEGRLKEALQVQATVENPSDPTGYLDRKSKEARADLDACLLKYHPPEGTVIHRVGPIPAGDLQKKHGRWMLPALLQYLDPGTSNNQGDIVGLLQQWGPDAIPPLIGILKSKDEAYVLVVCDCLATLWKGVPEVLPSLKALAADDSRSPRLRNIARGIFLDLGGKLDRLSLPQFARKSIGGRSRRFPGGRRSGHAAAERSAHGQVSPNPETQIGRRRVRLIRLLSLVLLAQTCSCRAPDGESSPVVPGITDLHTFSEAPRPTGDEVRDAFEYTVWAESLQGYSSYVVHENRTTNILQPIPGETDLRRAGKDAAPSVVEFLSTRKPPDVVVARLLGVLGASREGALLPFLAKYLAQSQPLEIRRAAIHAIVELGDARGGDLAQSALQAGALPKQDVLWALFRLGHPVAEEEYIHLLTLLLKPSLDLPTREGPRIVRPKDEGRGADRPEDSSADHRPAGETTFILDLINLSESRSVRGLGLLIEALRHQDHELQHLVLELLSRVVRDRDRIPAGNDLSDNVCKSLLNGAQYRVWKSWYDKNKSALGWSPEAGRFCIQTSPDR